MQKQNIHVVGFALFCRQLQDCFCDLRNIAHIYGTWKHLASPAVALMDFVAVLAGGASSSSFPKSKKVGASWRLYLTRVARPTKSKFRQIPLKILPNKKNRFFVFLLRNIFLKIPNHSLSHDFLFQYIKMQKMLDFSKCSQIGEFRQSNELQNLVIFSHFGGNFAILTTLNPTPFVFILSFFSIFPLLSLFIHSFSASRRVWKVGCFTRSLFLATKNIRKRSDPESEH